MKTRRRTKFVMKLKKRRCSKCNATLHPHRKRCKRCQELQARPKR